MSDDFKTVSYKKNVRRVANDNTYNAADNVNGYRSRNSYQERPHRPRNDRHDNKSWRQPAKRDSPNHSPPNGPSMTDPVALEAFNYDTIATGQSRFVPKNVADDIKASNVKILDALNAINTVYSKTQPHRDLVQQFYNIVVDNICKAAAIAQRTMTMNIEDNLYEMIPVGMENERSGTRYHCRKDKSAACADYNLQSVINGVCSVVDLINQKPNQKPMNRFAFDQRLDVGETAAMKKAREEHIAMYQKLAEYEAENKAIQATDSWADASEVSEAYNAQNAVLDLHAVSIVNHLRIFVNDPRVVPHLADLKEKVFNAKIDVFDSVAKEIVQVPLIDPAALDMRIAKRAKKRNVQTMELVARGSAYAVHIMECYEAKCKELFPEEYAEANKLSDVIAVSDIKTPPNTPEPVTDAPIMTPAPKPKITLAPQGLAQAAPRKKKFDLNALNQDAQPKATNDLSSLNLADILAEACSATQ